jgi:hypothetical protein
VSKYTAKWLLVLYRVGNTTIPVGVALYALNELYLQLQYQLNYAAPDEDLALLAQTDTAVREIRFQSGPEAAFKWMKDSLTGTICVEGPYNIITNSPETTTQALYSHHCIARANNVQVEQTSDLNVPGLLQ